MIGYVIAAGLKYSSQILLIFSYLISGSKSLISVKKIAANKNSNLTKGKSILIAKTILREKDYSLAILKLLCHILKSEAES